ncbi:hypothetical protein [Ornithobacterium rhinotracheale]|uniref:hypothetical protein n=1 Tax=Ornithobacterium rhinotracheale TaxID=28251 RepID=UPI001FF4685B|nr:hypothetical protein [Ornithobacterium rhinotracheale]MCK0205936.1 hypothetical protein [Ornithobacterium rhinotracheale]
MKKLTALLALVSIGGFAYYKYRMTPEQKKQLKDKIDSAKKEAEVLAKDLKENVNQKLEQAKEELDHLRKEAKDTSKNLLKEAEEMYN